ncbi:MAG: matrixin family metalloprotease [Gammaproteobacteria bacterium]|nr:matrixin family metalloprotease [Gammaproteobacteria bacterium]
MTRRLPGKAYAVGVLAVLLLCLTQVVGRSYAPTGHRWFSGDIPVFMRLNLESRWANASVDSLREWNAAGAAFQFSSIHSSGGSVSCSRPNHRNDVVISSRHCEGFDWGSTVAITGTWFDGVTGQAIDSDIVFNGNESWDVYYGPVQYHAIDFRRVATHEFGHVLGLDHPDDYGQRRHAIMNAYVSDIDRLQTDDIDGIRSIYGRERPRGTPDLVVDSLSTSPETLSAGENFTLEATVRNAGDGPAAATTLRYHYRRSSADAWVVVGSDHVDGLPAQSQVLETIRLTAPSRAGTHYYRACVASVAGERNTDNCSRSLRVTVADPGTPDLVVDSLWTSPATLTAGQPFTLMATVRNVGDGTASATTLRYYYRSSTADGWAVVGSDPVDSLAAAAAASESVRLTAPSLAGTHYYNACVSSAAGERDTGNNCSGSLPVTVTGGAGNAPDLAVDPLRTSPAPLTAGETFTLSTRVRNVGDGAASATTLRYYRYGFGSGSWVVVGTDPVGGLPASTSRPESIRLRAPSRPGTYYYSACVTSATGERDKDNNCSGSLRVNVTGGGIPDLTVDALRTSPTALTVGGTFTLSTRVRNVGDGAASATTLRYYYYEARSGSWVVVGTDPVGGLPASTSRSESIRLRAPSRPGVHSYSACVAPVAGERDKDDNCAETLRVTVER